MAIEILAARILAPYFGSSLLTWTCVIGVILAALSAGYYLGGMLADKKHSVAQFASIILLAGIFTAAIPLFSAYTKNLFQYGPLAGPLLASLFIFAVPNILLGMVSPYAIKLNTHALARVGSSAGSLYALSTVGSIVGTFATGFYLIPSFGVRAILLATSLLLMLLPLLLLGRRALPAAFASMLAVLLISSLSWAQLSSARSVLYEADSPYYHVRVVQEEGSSTRLLYLDRQLASGKHMGSEIFFSKYMACTQFVFLLRPDAQDVLFIGLGGGMEPAYAYDNYAAASIDVFELDPQLVEVSKTYFGFSEAESLHVLIGDARTALAASSSEYDVIRVDVFNSHDSIPFHLTTTEAVQEMKAHLRPGGFVATNIISAVEGPASDFFRAEYKTYKANFRYVAAIAIAPQMPEEAQNILLIGTDSGELTRGQLAALAGDDAQLMQCADGLLASAPETDDVPVLTDDYAPVEAMLAKLDVLERLNRFEGR